MWEEANNRGSRFAGRDGGGGLAFVHDWVDAVAIAIDTHISGTPLPTSWVPRSHRRASKKAAFALLLPILPRQTTALFSFAAGI